MGIFFNREPFSEYLNTCALFSQSRQALLGIEPKTACITAANPRARSMLAPHFGAVTQLSLIDSGQVAAESWQSLTARLRSGQPLNEAVFELKTPHDQRICVKFSAAMLNQQAQDFVLITILDSLPEADASRQALNEKLARHFFYEARDAMTLTDQHGRIECINQAGAEIFKRPIADLTGRIVWNELDDYRYVASQLSAHERIKTTQGPLVYEELPDETLSGKHFHVIAEALRDLEGEVVAVKRIRRDISERVANEKLDLQRNKLEAIGTLAAGIAHDFNNILGGVMLNSELALLDPTTNDETRVLLDNILTAGRRARDLVSQIMTFSRQESCQKAEIDLLEALKENLRFLRATIPAGINLEFNCELERAKLLANPAHLSQLIVNIVTNAARAIGPNASGKIEVTLAARTIDAQSAQTCNLAPGAYWNLSFIDDGCGMAPAVVARASEPFFTTNAETSGMGLAVVHGIVQNLGGALQIDSAPGRGTKISILLPSRLEPAAAAVAATPRVMLVEDDAVIRTATAKMLKKLSCTVAVCQDAQQALQLIESAPADWDLLITDLSLPGIQGLDLARQVNRLRPDLPIILSTGYHDRIGAQALSEAGISLVLDKPFTRSELADCLNKALRSSDLV